MLAIISYIKLVSWGRLMGAEVVVELDVASCMHVKLEREVALKLVQAIMARHGVTRDLEETKRVIENFDEYYGILKRRFMDYLTIPKDTAESIRGRTVVHKIRLIREGEYRIVEFVFDKRVSRDLIVECLKDVGFSSVSFRQL